MSQLQIDNFDSPSDLDLLFCSVACRLAGAEELCHAIRQSQGSIELTEPRHGSPYHCLNSKGNLNSELYHGSSVDSRKRHCGSYPVR